MTINVTSVAKDALGFPKLDWYEDRGNKKQICCSAYITTGSGQELYFASDGGFLSDSVYRKRPWEKLVGFRMARARDLYYSNMENRMREELKREFLWFRMTLENDAVVMLADVADEHASVPMHLSYGTGTPVELEQLHSALHHHFLVRRQSLIDSLCNGEYRLPPKADPWLVDERRLRGLKAMNEAAFAERSIWSRLFGK